jgi:hypothetical protein
LFFFALTILSIVGYGFFVFAAGPIIYSPGETLNPDPGCLPDGDCYVDLSLGGVSIGSPIVNGTPNQILYTDADGKVFGDSVFTRDSTTGNTNIGLANGVAASSMSILNTGNTLIWDADTTDGVIAKLSQSDDIFGIGIKGNLNLYQDTNTNQKAFSIVGDGTSVGVPGYFVISEVSDTTGQLHAKQVLIADDAAGINTTYYNEATDTSVLQVFNGSGSALTWDADTTDDIVTSFEQSEDLFGVGVKGNLIIHKDTTTGARANVIVGDITAIGGEEFQISMNTDDGTGNLDSWFDLNHENGVFTGVENLTSNITSSLGLSLAGNTLTWDADTTDDIQDIITQSQNIAGIGLIGSGIAHTNTSTGETADLIIGDLTAVAGRPFSANMGYSNGVGNIRHNFLADDTGAAMSHRDTVANTIGFMTTFPGGNLSTWIADTTGTIQTKLEQSQDILTLGFMSGSALTWQDSSTDLVTFNGSGDATGLGAGPATSIMATFDTALGDSASVSTTYDTVTSEMVVVANARTGAIQANVSLSSVDSVLNYRTGVVGQEATFTANAASTYMGYQATTASDVYRVIVGDGTFTFLNTTTNDNYLSLDSVTGAYGIGDLDGAGSSTRLSIDDANQAITFGYTGSSYTFPIGDGTSNYLLATDGLGQIFWQDPTMVPSDRSLKSNVNELSYGLDTLMQLNPVSYTMNSTGKEQIGFIAQEVESLVPELVGEVANGKKGLAYGQMTAVIVKSIQELNLKITDIENFATAENKTFLNGLIAWLGDASNGITSIFVGRINTHELCVDGQCLNQDDVRQLIQLKNQMGGGGGSAPAPVPDPTPVTPTPGPITEEVVPGSEPEVIPEPEPEPEPVPETVPDPIPEVAPTE